MNSSQRSEQRARLAQLAARRYESRTELRNKKLQQVNEVGVLASAGPAAIRRTAHMTPSEGRSLLADAPLTGAATAAFAGRLEALPDQRRIFEAVVGGFDDSDNVNFLHRGIRACRTVCRLVQSGQPVGTGFLVAPGLILTNNHVIASAEEAATFVAEFDYELDIDDQPRRPVVRFDLDPDAAFVTSSAEEQLDYTFVAVRPLSQEGSIAITAFGWLPLDPRRDKILEGEPAVIIQHPRGDPKRLCLFAAELVDRVDEYIHYTTDTDGGSSGSPVFNRGWQLVGLHHAATRTGEPRRGHPLIVNEGIRVSSIIDSLAQGGVTEGNPANVLAAVSQPAVIGNGRPQAPAPAPTAAPAGIMANGASFERGTVIRTRSPGHFAGRDATHQGYKPDFLGGEPVPLPVMPQWMQEEAARLVNDAGTSELRYTHYSAVVSTPRRLPIFTAANIDGAKSRALGRTDRNYEAADKWYYDGRIPLEAQLGPEIYDGTAFDFGHMVRREDPAWGDDNTARMANDDTFYMTNCAPQHSDLNQRSWLALENAVLQSARKYQVRISVFTGPVLSPQDPTIRSIQVPTAFWKIIAYQSGGHLRAHGFMQWQTGLVATEQGRLEALDLLEKAVEYQVPIRDIARDTSLDFGPLIAADTNLVTTAVERLDGAAARGAIRERHRLNEHLIEALEERLAEASAGEPAEPAKRAELVNADPTGRLPAAPAAPRRSASDVDAVILQMLQRVTDLLAPRK